VSIGHGGETGWVRGFLPLDDFLMLAMAVASEWQKRYVRVNSSDGVTLTRRRLGG
jgi:hypothetical protein